MKVRIKNESRYGLPEFKHVGDAGCDLIANIESPITLGSLDRVMVPTGVYIALPNGYEAQIRPRSGLAAKHGISVTNTPGTIDSGYRNQISVLLINLSKEPYTINPGDRIAQMVIAKHETAEWDEVEELDDTERGFDGFGSTGK